MDNSEFFGELAVVAVQKRCAETGWIFCRPNLMSTRYDAILEKDGKMIRAQIKRGFHIAKSFGPVNTIKVNLKKHGNCYTAAEIDILLIHLVTLDKVLWIPVSVIDGKNCIYVRLSEIKNEKFHANKKSAIIAAKDYIW